MPVPPDAEISIVPSSAPLQVISVVLLLVSVIASGSLTVRFPVTSGPHPLSSDTLIVYVPAERPENEPVKLSIVPGFKV